MTLLISSWCMITSSYIKVINTAVTPQSDNPHPIVIFAVRGWSSYGNLYQLYEMNIIEI